MSNQLTGGSIAEMIQGGRPDGPHVQILSFKMIPNSPQERYRMLVSDGVWCSTFAMLATQHNHLITSGEINMNCIVRLDRYVCNTVQGNKKVLIILDLTVLQSGANLGKIGDPLTFDPNKPVQEQMQQVQTHAQPQQNSASKPQLQQQSTVVNAQTPRNPLVQRPPPNMAESPSSQGGSNHANIHPIVSLTPYQNKWTIRARVTYKSDIRTWQKPNSEGKLFSCNLLDESGEIRATGFNQECDRFYEMLETNKVFLITGGQLKTANKQFSNVKNDYELTFGRVTEITSCEEDDVSSIPALQYSFVSIGQLVNTQKDDIVDVIGVCKSAEDVAVIVAKASGREMHKRQIQILDDTGNEVSLTLWGTIADNFDGSSQPIVAVKGAKVSDFGGRSLSMSFSAILTVNPDIREAHRIKGWFDNVGHGLLSTVNISVGGPSSGGGGRDSNCKTFAEAKYENCGAGPSGDYYTSVSTVTLIKRDNAYYKSCPITGCNKKLQDMQNGMYRCEKCSREFDTFNYRLMLSMNLADITTNIWATAFNETAENILGIDAQEAGALAENEPDLFADKIAEVTFQRFLFRLRVKMDSYNDEQRLKTTIVEARKLEPRDQNKRLISEIKQLAGLA